MPEMMLDSKLFVETAPNPLEQKSSARSPVTNGPVPANTVSRLVTRAASGWRRNPELEWAGALQEEGKLAEAEMVEREALARRLKQDGAASSNVAQSLHDLSMIREKEGHVTEAEQLERDALAICKKLSSGIEDTDVAYCLWHLGDMLCRQGKFAEAESLSRGEVAIWKKYLGNEHIYAASALNRLAIELREQGNLADSENAFREVVAIQTKAVGKERPNTRWAVSSLVAVLEKEGKTNEVKLLLEGLPPTPSK